MKSSADPWHDALVTAENRCPSCGGFLYAGGACGFCQTDTAGDDDFDILAAHGTQELSLELEGLAKLSQPPPPAPVGPVSDARERPRTITPPPAVRPPNTPVRTDRTSSRPTAGPDAVASYARFSAPHASSALHFIYFVRTWNRRERLIEKAALLRRTARTVSVELETRYAKLGQAVFDEPNEAGRFPDLAPLVENARAASVVLGEIVTSKESAAAHAARAKDLAASRLERASAALDPIEEIEREARHAMSEANARVAEAADALGARERALRDDVDQGRTDAETLKTADREIEALRAKLENARKIQRDAALKASDVRRRVLVEASRVAEAQEAVDGAVRAGRAEQRAQERIEHDAAERFHHACVALGRAAYDLGAGQTLKGTFWDAKKTRDAQDAVIRHADTAERARDTHDVEAYERGRIEMIGLGAAALFAVLFAIAS